MPSPQHAKFKPAWQIRHHLLAREPLQNATRTERHWVTHEPIQSLRTHCQYRTHRLCLPADSAAGASANCEIPSAAGSPP